MNKKLLYLFALIVVVATTGCEKLLMTDSPQANPVAVLHEYYTMMKEKYAFFELKGVNWDSLYQIQRDRISENSTDAALFEALSAMAAALKDGHVTLFNPNNNAQRYHYTGYYEGYPENYDWQIVENNYLLGTGNVVAWQENENGWWWWGGVNGEEWMAIRYTRLNSSDSAWWVQDGLVGYVRIPTFDLTIMPTNLAWMINNLQGTQGIILDLRSNSGGDPKMAALFAAHLTASRLYTGYERFKISPAPDGFSENIDLYLEPADNSAWGMSSYEGEVVILTNRRTFSAAALLVQQLSNRQNVTVIGDTTGGGGGWVADGVLANGWVYTYSASQLYDAKGRNVEAGIPPDMALELDQQLLFQGVDTLIERAKDLILN